MNREIPPTPKKPVRTTITVDADVLEVFQRLASVTGMSQSKAIGEWLADTVDAAATMANLMEKARQQPKLVAMELRGYALGLSDLTADLLEQVKGKSGAAATPAAGGKRSAAAAGDDAAPRRLGDLLGGLTPPVGNTGGKLPRKPKNRG